MTANNRRIASTITVELPLFSDEAFVSFEYSSRQRLSMLTKIYQVDSIELQILKMQPPILYIIAQGTVTSTGWKNGQLVPYIYITPPADGIYEFDFVSEPPTGISLPVLMPTMAEGQWQDFPQELKGVKIYASTNSLIEKLSDSKEIQALEGGGSGNPRGLFVS